MRHEYGGVEYEGGDFYLYHDTDVLMNRFNIRDYDNLQEIERRFSAARIALLAETPLKGVLDFNYLKKIHKFIFDDIYSWAGRVRGGKFFSKGDTMFCIADVIPVYADNTFGKLRGEKWLRGLERTVFIERLAYYMAELNALHPFREGNGRTQRAFFAELARRARYGLDFSATDPDALLEADINAYNRDYALLTTILDNAVVREG
jgi:cell filamentation protein